MTVKQLQDLLTQVDGAIEVRIRVNPDRWTDYEPEISFSIASVTQTYEPDTAERIVVLECDQQPE